MGNDHSESKGGVSNRQTRFNPERYGMVICPDCKGNGYIKGAKRQCCPRCGGFGFIKKENLGVRQSGSLWINGCLPTESISRQEESYRVGDRFRKVIF